MISAECVGTNVVPMNIQNAIAAVQMQLYQLNQCIEDRSFWPEALPLVPVLRATSARIIKNLDGFFTVEPDEQSLWFLLMLKNMIRDSGDKAMKGVAPDSSSILFSVPTIGRAMSDSSEQKTLFLVLLMSEICSDLQILMHGVGELLVLTRPAAPPIDLGAGPAVPVLSADTGSSVGSNFGTVLGYVVLGVLFIGAPIGIAALSVRKFKAESLAESL